LRQKDSAMKRIMIGMLLLGSMVYAGQFELGKKIFEQRCMDCHVGYIAPNKIKDNFFEKQNSVYMLTSPSVNMIADAITKGPKHIGKIGDAGQQAQIAKYLKGMLYQPKRENSICDPAIMKYYDDKKPLSVRLNDAQIMSLVRYFMDYEKHRNPPVPLSTDMLTLKYNAVTILAEARARHKRILIEASSDHCTWCEKMKKEVFPSEEVQGLLKEGYVFVDINVDKHKLPYGLDKKFKQITPTFFLLESDGSIVDRHPGSYFKDDFVQMLKENMLEE